MDGGDEAVDVSWLHHSQRADNAGRGKNAPARPTQKQDEQAAGDGATPHEDGTSTATTTTTNGHAQTQNSRSTPTSSLSKPLPIPSESDEDEPAKQALSPPTQSQSPAQAQAQAQVASAAASTAILSGVNQTTVTSTPAKPTPPKPIPRRNSWISTLSSKFTSGSTPPSQSYMRESPSNSKQQPDAVNPFGAAYSPKDADKSNEGSGSFTSGSLKSGHPSFFHTAFRKLSSSGGSGLGKLGSGHAPNGGVWPRRVMNIDAERDRCKIPELNQAKLRRVAFCVDVEIAGTARRSEGDDDKTAKKKPDAKAVEAEEGTVLKTALGHGPSSDEPSPAPNVQTANGTAQPADRLPNDEEKSKPPPTKKQEKKKRSEEERKERKEKRRRQAEENGSVPLQVNMDGGSNSTSKSNSIHRSSRGQDQPTTDPLRIYRRCCQLRETGVLKKLVEQISSPSSILAESPGTVAVLDLTGFSMTLTDIITFSDWLSIVPVRKLILQDCGLSDEAVRVILGGLLATKTIEAAKQARQLKQRHTGETLAKEMRYGAIEKLSLKGNSKLGHEGWRHICLFIHMSRSLKGIDLSGIPFPRPALPTNGPVSPVSRTSKPISDIGTIFANALSQRFGGERLEELVLSECSPSTEDVQKICEATRSVGLRRLGLANNGLTKEGLEYVIGYFQGGKCEGLDLGGNKLEAHIGLFASAIEKSFPLSALSLADCSLTPKTLCSLMQGLTLLPNFRFIDLSHNRDLFITQPDSLGILRRYLPQMQDLRRIHLADVCLGSEHAIALAEILPDCPKLCHINILENPAIEELASANTAEAQEEACALYASFMSAARISRNIIAIDIDIPTPENNEVVKALASQIVAYCLRNLQYGELKEELSSSIDSQSAVKDVPVPDILAHLVGHTDDANEDIDDSKVTTDDDYVIGGTGVVKALGICLGNSDYTAVDEVLGEQSPTASGTSTPYCRLSQVRVTKKPRDMSRDLLNSARKIRLRLQPALVREDRAGNDLNYRRLYFLDMTLQRMIQRFEDEFPDTRIPDETSTTRSSDESPNRSNINDSAILEPQDSSANPNTGDDDEVDRYAVRLSRASSNTSLHSRALTSEEGTVHRLSHHLNHTLLHRHDKDKDKDKNQDQDQQSPEKPISQSPPDAVQVQALREKLERLRGLEGQETHAHTDTEGRPSSSHSILQEGTSNLEELLALQKQDPEAFAELKESHIVALINAGLRSSDDA
ncbi:cell wall biogenesis protein Mhp1 [Arthroderma uncinatum]|uniref:cell wall biogenesis protein Mhp1 n=1 Tax=Arthroderma uncinatum TaxID=74035 RepID=UPI00144A6B13|nr:cell wall biogenesis protein Mhp1 [Arthroderma uncinatum]KAF3482544.1 cell wall biogenesis protein Mhp1 [Arthroderma uncinatum]